MIAGKGSTSRAGSAAVRGCTCAKLRRLTRRLTAIYDRELAAAGLRVTQFSLLGQLRNSDGITVCELATALDLDRTTLTRNLIPLQAAGWVTVLPATDDARVRVVRLTTDGEKRWQIARVHWRRAQDEINATLGLAEVGALHAQLDAALPLFRPVTELEETVR